MKISKNKKMCFSMSQGYHSTKKLGSQAKRCTLQVVHGRTDTQTDRMTMYSGYPFRVSGVFPSTHHQGSAQQAQRRTAAGRSRHKSHGVIQYQGSYFPTRCPKWIFMTPIVLVEKKHTKLIYHMPWLYQFPSLLFQRSYEN